MFHLASVGKKQFMDDVRANPQAYADGSAGEWQVHSDGKEDTFYRLMLPQGVENCWSQVAPSALTTQGVRIF